MVAVRHRLGRRVVEVAAASPVRCNARVLAYASLLLFTSWWRVNNISAMKPLTRATPTLY